MRIAEIAVVAPHTETRKNFIAAICRELEVNSEQLMVGRLSVNDQLLLHLYGLAAPSETVSSSAWDLLARKLLGYIVLFHWQDEGSFQQIKPCLEQITARAATALIIAANVTQADLPALEALRDKNLLLNAHGKLAFYQENDAESIKKVLLTLIDLLLEHAE